MSEEHPGAAEWAGVVLLCGSAVLSALLELLFLSQFYIGTVIVPLVVLATLAGNVLLPYWGFRAVHAARGAVLPIACWLLTVLGLSLYTRPEGDLFVINAYMQQGAFYALLLVGAAAGFATTFVVTGQASRPAPRPPAPSRPTPDNRRAAKGPRVSR